MQDKGTSCLVLLPLFLVTFTRGEGKAWGNRDEAGNENFNIEPVQRKTQHLCEEEKAEIE